MDIHEILLSSTGMDPRGLNETNSVLIGEHRVPVIAYAFFTEEELRSSVDFSCMVGDFGELRLHSNRDECITSTRFEGEDGFEDAWLMLYFPIENSKENFLLKKMVELALRSPGCQFSMSEEFFATEEANPIIFMLNSQVPELCVQSSSNLVN